MMRSYLRNNSEDALTAAEAYESAERAWPVCGAGHARVWAFVHAAILRSAEQSQALADVNRECQRTCDFGQHLNRILGHAQKEQMISTLRSQSELQQAAKLFERNLDDRPGLNDWHLARLLGNAELERKMAAVFEQPEARMKARIRAKLNPNSENARETLELFLSHPSEK
jgi:hypothetical protein